MRYLLVWAGLTAVIWAGYAALWAGKVTAFNSRPITGIMVPVMVALLTAGPALLVILLLRGRLSGAGWPGIAAGGIAVLLAMLTPVINFNWFPLPYGLFILNGFWPPLILMVGALLAALWYGILALLRAGLRNRQWESLGALLMMGCAYAFIMLWQGVGTFDMR